MKKNILLVVLSLLIIGLGFYSYNIFKEMTYYKEKNITYSERIEKLEKENDELKASIINSNSGIVEDDDFIVSSDSEYSNLKEITVSDLSYKIESGEKFMLLISQTGCGHCISFKPVFNDVLKENNLISYEINLTRLSLSERNLLDGLVRVSGTPTTVVFENGVENNNYRIVGNASKDKINIKLKSASFIK